MPSKANPDNGRVESGQGAGAGDVPVVGSATIEGPIPRLREGVDADGLLEKAQQGPDAGANEARKAEGQPKRG